MNALHNLHNKLRDALQYCIDDYECSGLDETTIPALVLYNGENMQSLIAYRKAKDALAALLCFDKGGRNARKSTPDNLLRR